MAARTLWTPSPTLGAVWTDAGFTLTAFNSLAVGSCVVGATALANQTDLDLWWTFSFSFVVGATTVAGNYLSLYALPLNQDGTTYGDNTGTGTVAPGTGYWLANASVLVGVTSGSAIVGSFAPQVIPPFAFKPAIVNNSVVFNATAAAAVKYQNFDINLNG